MQENTLSVPPEVMEQARYYVENFARNGHGPNGYVVVVPERAWKTKKHLGWMVTEVVPRSA